MELKKKRILIEWIALLSGISLFLFGILYEYKTRYISTFFTNIIHYNPLHPDSFEFTLRGFKSVPSFLIGLFLVSFGLSRYGNEVFNKIKIKIEANFEKRILLIILLLTFIICIIINIYILQSGAISIDETCYLIQANLFARLKLWGEPPPPGHLTYMAVYTGINRMFGGHFLGHSIPLSIGILLGMDFLIPALLGSITCLMLFLFFKEVFGLKIATWATFLLFLSPFHIFISSGYMSHCDHLLFLLLAFYLLELFLKRKRDINIFFSGFSIGFAFFIRPLETLPIVFILMILIIYKLRKKSIKPFLFFGLGGGIWLFVIFLTNYLFSGSIFITPMSMVSPWVTTRLIPFSLGWTFFKGILQVYIYSILLSFDLFGWWGNSLIFIIIFMIFGRNRFENHWTKIFMLILMIAIVYQVIMQNNPITPYGARYFYAAIPLLILLTIKGIETAAKSVKKLGIPVYSFMGYIIIGFFLLSFAFYIPLKQHISRNIIQSNAVKKGFPTREARNIVLNAKRPAVVLFTDMRALHALYYLNQKYPDLKLGLSSGLMKDLELKSELPEYNVYYLKSLPDDTQILESPEWGESR
ncbi:MAG: glycosyltransferase family 39 protein [Candidatus Coatesbacteria bacterium]|nr:glycosyltransferase family 39 protein [Candidatus Coatesbacteria bacterium]